MRKVHILPIAVMAFAVVGFLFVLNYSISDGKWPWSSEKAVTSTTVNTSGNVNVEVNTNASSNTNTTSSTNAKDDATKDWKMYTNTTYNYSIKYPTGYTVTEKNTVEKTTPEQVTFYKGNRSTSTASIGIYSMTPTNKNLFGEENNGWYDWAIKGFPKDGSDAAGLSENKRSETYGSKTFTVINFDGGSSWSGSPFYYYVSGTTVYIIVDFRTENNVPRNSVTQVHQMLATFTTTNPTTDWKTYSNSSVGYSVKYPSTLVATECDKSPNSFVVFDFKTSKCGEALGVFDIVQANTDTITIWKNSLTSVTQSTVEVGGITAQRIQGTLTPGLDSGGKDVVLVTRNSNTLRLRYNDVSQLATYQQTFNSLMSTFTFTK